MVANILASIDLRCLFGFACAELLCWLYWSINRQTPDILPAPRCDLIARGGHDAWTVTLINNKGT